mmetsp:Transcript_25871/g.65219  ORF Transcript_25871/g.65219 Transcript_25871/m.65219 type:complete len:150 (-) Transcript_25871:2221-2670(-)|eukprot:g20908.t1
MDSYLARKRRVRGAEEELERLLADHVASKRLIARPIVRIYVVVAVIVGLVFSMAFTALRSQGVFERLGFRRDGILGSGLPSVCLEEDYVVEELKKLADELAELPDEDLRRLERHLSVAPTTHPPSGTSRSYTSFDETFDDDSEISLIER